MSDSPHEPAESDSPKPLAPIYNWLSITGALIAIAGAGAGLHFLIMLSRGDAAGYGFVALLPFSLALVLGAALLLIGDPLERRRRKKGRPPSIRPETFDLRLMAHGRVVLIFVLGSVILVFATLSLGAVSTMTMHYVESNAFCGNTCHTVMSPEATVYEDSPHARIECVECHAGEGPGSFIRANLSGVRQLVAVARGRYSKPIPTPIHNLRPSREMCEGCHWPDRLIEHKTLVRRYFRGNDENSSRGLRIMMKINGGGDDMFGGQGIHYHMLIARKVEFVARDPQRQDIVWVRVTRDDGSVVEYDQLEKPLSDSERQGLEVRTMECLDCHNRPAHRFGPPTRSVNRALARGEISPELPGIKREAVRLLDGGYGSADEASLAISQGLRAFYRERHPEVLQHDGETLDGAIAKLQKIYRRTIFPEMKADWSAHPDNIGHRDWRGCFRCHNHELESEAGDAISTECDSCHSILTQVDPEEDPEGDTVTSDFDEGMAFLHPDGDEYVENQTACFDCHDGGFRVYSKKRG